jgi:hypothetical protein
LTITTNPLAATHTSFLALRPGAYNGVTLIEFLNELHEVEQRPMLLIWCGLPSHRSRRMLDWVAASLLG